MLKIVSTVTLDYIMTMHKFMKKLRLNDLSESHVCETGRQHESTTRLQVEFPLSPFSLTSCPVAAVSWRCCLKHVWQGDVQVSKAQGGETAAVQLRNFANSSSPASLQQKTGQHGVFFFLHVKKGKFKFYFSFHKSVPAFLQVIWGFSHLIWLFV